MYRFDYEFQGMQAEFIVVSTYGHVYSRDFENKDKIFKVDPQTLFTAKIYKYYLANINSKKNRRNKNKRRNNYELELDFSRIDEYLQQYLLKADLVMLWLD